MNILFLYWIYIKSMNMSHYGFICLVNFSNEKYIRGKKKKFLDIILRKNRYQVFVNYLRILSIWQILFLFIFASFGIHKLFLFLFLQKLAPQIYSYSYSREKLLFADHCIIHWFNIFLLLGKSHGTKMVTWEENKKFRLFLSACYIPLATLKYFVSYNVFYHQ